MPENLFSWIFFSLILLILFSIDMFFHKENKKIPFKEACLWSLGWISIALLFNLYVWQVYGSLKAQSFLAAYLVEESLSIDNLFVFLIIFKAFHIPEIYRHKVLFWGILSAIIMRGIFIAGGILLVSHFSWSFYLFGIFLIYTAVKLALQKDEEIHPEKSPLIIWLKKHLPIVSEMADGAFLIRQKGKLYGTPLLLALIAIEISDLLFALDSIPAVIGITTDPFIVYTSNIFAILGLRSLYFALQGMIDLFHHLHYGLAAILFFIGFKMVFKDFIHIEIPLSLAIIASCILLSILASLLDKKRG